MVPMKFPGCTSHMVVEANNFTGATVNHTVVPNHDGRIGEGGDCGVAASTSSLACAFGPKFGVPRVS